MRWIGLLAAIVACSGDEEPTKGDSGTPDTMNPTNPDPTNTEDTSAALAARVVDADGNPVNGAQVRFCRGPLCKFADADADGRFGFDEVPIDWHSLEVFAPAGNDTLATAFVPIIFETETERQVDLVMPPLDPATTLTSPAAPISVGTGLQITLAAGDLEPPAFVEEATEVAGVRLTEDQWVPMDEQDGTVVAQWFLDPFDHDPLTDIPMAFANDYALADGVQLKVLVGGYDASQWLDAGTLTVAGGEITGTANLPVTSTVVLLDVSPSE